MGKHLFYPKRFFLEAEGDSVYQEFEKYLPLKTCNIESYEVDNSNDLEIALDSKVFKHDFYSNIA